jgi:hypothetical protein
VEKPIVSFLSVSVVEKGEIKLFLLSIVHCNVEYINIFYSFDPVICACPTIQLKNVGFLEM